MPTLTFDHLTKSYGQLRAVDDLDVVVHPGRITAFLGANGSGKTTSMRTLLGLTEPTAGAALIGGVPYRSLKHPLRVVGAVLDLVGLTSAAGRWTGAFSLGMRQRLALAAALVGEPEVLVLDEPFNGLDPMGIAVMRRFLRSFADQGGAVFLSSHLLAEVAHSADEAVIIDHGHLVSAGPVDQLMPQDAAAVTVTTPDAALLAEAILLRGGLVLSSVGDQLHVTGLDREVIAHIARDAGALVFGLQSSGDDLEEVFATLIHQEIS